DRPARALRVRRTGGVASVARLREITDAGRGPAHCPARALRVRRTRGIDSVARLRGIADAGRRPAYDPARHSRVHRTRAAGSRAVLRRIADARRRAADRTARLEDVDARVGAAHAVVGRVDVADPALRGTGTRRRRGGEAVRGTRGATPRAVLHQVA